MQIPTDKLRHKGRQRLLALVGRPHHRGSTTRSIFQDSSRQVSSGLVSLDMSFWHLILLATGYIIYDTFIPDSNAIIDWSLGI